jgi:multiple sugar transport system permease protein
LAINSATNVEAIQNVPKKRPKRLLRRLEHWWFLLPSVLAILFIFVYPIGKALQMSFFDIDVLDGSSVFAGLKNYQAILSQADFKNSLYNSAIWTFGSVAGQLGLGLAVALLLNEKFKGVKIMRSLILIPWIMPGLAIALIWKFMLNGQLGLVNDILSKLGYEPLNWLGSPGLAMFSVIMINIWKAFPFAALTFLAGLSAIPKDQYEAAHVDGANIWQRFWHITLPSLKYVSVILALLSTIWTFNYFDIIFSVTGGGPAKSTEILPTMVYRFSFENFQYGLGSAAAIIIACINMVFAVLYLRMLKEEGGQKSAKAK